MKKQKHVKKNYIKERIWFWMPQNCYKIFAWLSIDFGLRKKSGK